MSEPEPQVELGIVNQEIPATGSSMKMVAGQVEADAGLSAEAAVVDIDYQSGDDWGIQASYQTASAEFVMGDEGRYAVGATHNEWEVGMSVGPPKGDPTRDDDVFVQAALSEGEGAAGRVYAGTDVDRDGEPEYGFGFDYDAYGVDVRVEAGAIREEADLMARAAEQGGQVLEEGLASAEEDAVAAYNDLALRAYESGGAPEGVLASYVADGAEAVADLAGDLYDAASDLFFGDDEESPAE